MTSSPATVAVSCTGLAKRFGAIAAVDDVSLDVARGEIVALLGPSGCGKTTFLRLVAGFERPDSGRIVLDDLAVADPRAFVPPERRRVGFVFQDYALFPHLTVADNIGFGLTRGERGARVDEVARLVGLSGLNERYPHELSGGQQQRVALARALAPRPASILLDEPFSNLDADLRERVRTEVRDILRAAGATAIFVTHDQDEAFAIADRVAVMRAGRIEQVGAPEEIYHTPVTRFVADFVGDADFLPAEVRAGRVVTEFGGFDLGDHAVSDGPCEIMTRPEDVRPVERSDAGARVVARRFRGPVTLVTIALPSGRTVTAAHPSSQRIDVGARVEVGFAPDHIVLFRDEARVAWVGLPPPK